VTLRHAFLFLIQKANYYWQLITAIALLIPLYLRPRRTTDRDVALLLVNTSLATWLTTKPIGDRTVLVTLRFENFAFPYPADRYDNRLVVECELTLPDKSEARPEHPFEARTLRFEWNGTPIESRDEQLSILAVMVSSVAHPVVHSFENQLYQSHAEPRLRDFQDFFLHGQYLNWCAWFWPGLMFRIGPRGHHWYKRVLEFNALLPLPKGHAPLLVPLAPYSRSVRFLLATRPMLVRLCDEYQLPLSSEALFICTILHAVDHASCDAHTRGHILRNEQLPNSGLFNALALLFYRPAQHFWTNLLKDKRRKNPFYEALYSEIRKVDPDLADRVTLSISY
jgi:hypothetical protein